MLLNKYSSGRLDFNGTRVKGTSSIWNAIVKFFNILKDCFRWYSSTQIPVEFKQIIYDIIPCSNGSSELGWNWSPVASNAYNAHEGLYMRATSFDVWLRAALSNRESFVGTSIWWIWRHHCNEIFNPTDSWSDYTVVALVRCVANDIDSCAERPCILRYHHLSLIWDPPISNSFKVNCDASIALNLELAGFGCIIKNSPRDWISACSGPIPK
ncbi:hypothetical protein PIB30_020734 [Stylosanthes scabra]|uniref:RNase H type-1 domain-containing protein n=1 Tax=Stylosanthes scabra TaxID=79078 RepID=A0ABU6Y5V7_9FABA|nr:hypothetical protein [Stylosanthes scabra]